MFCISRILRAFTRSWRLLRDTRRASIVVSLDFEDEPSECGRFADPELLMGDALASRCGDVTIMVERRDERLLSLASGRLGNARVGAGPGRGGFRELELATPGAL